MVVQPFQNQQKKYEILVADKKNIFNLCLYGWFNWITVQNNVLLNILGYQLLFFSTATLAIKSPGSANILTKKIFLHLPISIIIYDKSGF